MLLFINFILTNRKLVLALLLIVFFTGIWSMLKLNLEAYPDISDTEVTIITQVYGLPAEEIESQITIPIERIMSSVPDVISKRSKSIFGLSVVQLIFESKSDVIAARYSVSEKLKLLDLPIGVKPELGPMTSSVGEIFRYVIEGSEDISLLREIQDYIVIPNLLQTKGVEDISNFGGLLKQFQVVIDPLQLEKYSLGIEDITSAINSNNQNTGGSFVIVGASQMNIHGIGKITKLEDIGNIIIQNRGGIPILIKDVATLEVGFLPPSGVVGYIDNERGVKVKQGIEGIVLLRKNENSIQTLKSIKVKIDEINREYMPQGIKIIPFYTRMELVNKTWRTVLLTIAQGCLLVFFVISIIMWNPRAGLITMLAVPFSLSFSFIFMYLFNIPVNLLSIGSIDFGVLVDSSIIVVEVIIRKFFTFEFTDFNEKLRSANEDVKDTIYFSILLVIVSLIPIFALERAEARLFSPMAWMLIFAILGSLLYSVVAVPILSGIFLKQINLIEVRFWSYIDFRYRRSLINSILSPENTILKSFGVLIFSILLIFTFGSEFLPEMEEGAFWIRLKLPAGISLKTASEYPEKLRNEFAKIKGVRSVMTQLGRNDTGTDAFGANRIEVLVQLESSLIGIFFEKNKNEIQKELQTILEETMPGASFSISQPILDTTAENSNGTSSDIAVFINGKNLFQIREIAKQIQQIMSSMEGSIAPAIEQENKQAQIKVEVDREKAARYGINVSDVNKIIEVGMGGLPVSYLYEEERKFAIVIRYSQESRNTVDKIAKIIIPAKGGQRVPISQIAKVYMEDGETIISRWNGLRMLVVGTNIEKRDQGSFARELEKRIKDEILIPEDINYDIGGQFENLERARERLLFVLPITIILLFLALAIYFRDERISAFVVLCNIPFSLAGGIFMLSFREMYFSISAGVGFIFLFGISLMTGVILVNEIENQKENSSKKKLSEQVVTAALIQFKSRFTVMIVAILGLVPAMFNSGVGSGVQRPMATVIVGGLISALYLNLFVSPVLYIWLTNRFKK
ncbi:MAG: CusA/CzcA family heavy metal efflux RND transporter [Leptospiraceae bacterium]|nr:CusA/CzcA family heavy metal efflux RND transporter [Leptospiraceae bacterium]